MNIIKAYAVNNLCYQAATPLKPVGAILHSTGANNPNLKRYVNCPEECGVNVNKNHWDNPMPEGRKVCVHGFIGYDKNKSVRFAQILPFDMACWGCGSGKKGSFNYNPNGHISVELCEASLTDKAYFNKVWDCAVELFADLCKQYKWNPLEEGVIVSHKEAHKMGYASNHGDPEHWLSKHDKTMDDFRAAVYAKLNHIPESIVQPTNGDWYVQLGAFDNLSRASQYNVKIQKLKVGGKSAPSYVKVYTASPKYRVCIKGFTSKEEANVYAHAIRKQTIDGKAIGTIVKKD